MIVAIFYLLIGLFASILVFIKRPKIVFQIPKEFEQLEKNIAEWLELPITQVKKGVQMTTADDTGLRKYYIERPMTTVPISAFKNIEELQTAGQVV